MSPASRFSCRFYWRSQRQEVACADSVPTGASPRPHCRFPGGVVSWEGHQASTRDAVGRNLDAR